LRFFRDRDFALITAAHALLNLAGFSIHVTGAVLPGSAGRIVSPRERDGACQFSARPHGVQPSGRLAGADVSSRRLALIGAAAMAVAQISIGMADAPANIPVLAASMFCKVWVSACFRWRASTFPPRRSRERIGGRGKPRDDDPDRRVVTAATVLMLIFQTVRSWTMSDGAADGVAFLAGFHAAFRFAAALPFARRPDWTLARLGAFAARRLRSSRVW